MNKWLDIIQQCCYPPTCLLCGDPGHRDLDVCERCLADLPTNDNACPRCGLPLPSGGLSASACGQCQSLPHPFDGTQAIFRYEGTVPYLIQSLKFRRDFACARLIGKLMAEKLRGVTPSPQLLLPVPLHRKRYQQRGFNQAIEIARAISQSLSIPLGLTHCVRSRMTPPQTNLGRKERKTNPHNAFRVVKPVAVDHVAIVDDVVTTCATAAELAKALKKTGVKRIDVWACARA